MINKPNNFLFNNLKNLIKMSNTKLTRLELATIKRTAITINGYKKRKALLCSKLEKTISDINSKIEEIDAMIDLLNKPIKEITGGLTADEYINKDTPEEDYITPQNPNEAIHDLNESANMMKETPSIKDNIL
jgi:hypothetical protein